MNLRFHFPAFALLCLLTFSSCGKIEKVLLKKEGSWLITRYQTKSTYNSVTLQDTTYLNWATLAFKDDGSGTLTPTDPADPKIIFTWKTDEENDVLFIYNEYTVGGISYTDTTAWDVLESKTKSQSWSRSESVPGIMGGFVLTDEAMDLERVD